MRITVSTATVSYEILVQELFFLEVIPELVALEVVSKPFSLEEVLEFFFLEVVLASFSCELMIDSPKIFNVKYFYHHTKLIANSHPKKFQVKKKAHVSVKDKLQRFLQAEMNPNAN